MMVSTNHRKERGWNRARCDV